MATHDFSSINLENFIKRWISLLLKPAPGLCLWLLPLWARLMLIHGAISIWGPSLTMVNDNTILYTGMWAYMDEGGDVQYDSPFISL